MDSKKLLRVVLIILAGLFFGALAVYGNVGGNASGAGAVMAHMVRLP